LAASEANSQTEKALMGLRSLIFGGEFPAGSRITELAASETLGLSRTPVREAMSRLIDEGVLERNATGGYRVVRYSMQDVIDGIEIRGVIEGTAARLAAERGGSSELMEDCRVALEALDHAVRPDRLRFDVYVRENAQFHALIARLADSPVVTREVERAARLPLASPSAFLQGQELIPDFRASLHLAQAQHRAIFEAIECREGARAEALAREHARLARRNFEFVIQRKPALIDRVPGLALVAT